MFEFIKEFISFFLKEKNIGYYQSSFFNYFGGIIVLSQGSVLAPFVYTLF